MVHMFEDPQSLLKASRSHDALELVATGRRSGVV
jgi:hypothetical protein